MTDWLDAAIAIGAVILGGGLLAGFAALKKADSEADKYSAEASHELVGASGEVVRMLRDEIDRMDTRIDRLERAVGAWEGWSDDVIELLDQAVLMIDGQGVDGSTLRTEIDKVKRSRPSRRAPLSSD